MRTPLEDGSHRVTTWSSLNPLSLAVLEDGEIYIGLESGIVEYNGYLEGTAQYQMRYFSNPLDFGNTSNLKFLKKFNVTIIGGQATEAILNWGYDYTSNYTKQALVFTSSASVSEYGIAEYNIAQYVASGTINTPKINTTGSGEVVTIGIESEINGSSFSIQKIDIHALLGRLI